MFNESGMFIPDFLPEEDRKALEKYTSNRLSARYGLGEKVAMVIVDMTRGFVEDRFTTGWAATGVSCADNIRRLLNCVRRHAIPVFFTKPSRWPTPTERGLWGKDVAGTGELVCPPDEAYEFYPILEPIPGEIVIEKQKPSAFFGTTLHAMLTFNRVDTLIVTGMVTSGCVRATVNDAFSYNVRPIIPLECVADRAQMSHQVELFDMAAKYADVVPLNVLMEELEHYVERRRLSARPR